MQRLESGLAWVGKDYYDLGGCAGVIIMIIGSNVLPFFQPRRVRLHDVIYGVFLSLCSVIDEYYKYPKFQIEKWLESPYIYMGFDPLY